MNDSPSPQSESRGQSSLAGLSEALLAWLRSRFRSHGEEDSVREALEELIETGDTDDEPVQEAERAILANILSLRDLTVADVMVPHADIVAVDAGATAEKIRATMTHAGHSRLPVFRDTMDDVIGIIHIKDLIGGVADSAGFSLEKTLRPVLFVSPSMRVLELLLEMRTTRLHMALVVDEYGGTDGLVTIEDLVEEIVGEIEDEHDRDVEPELTEQGEGVFEADARLPIEDLEAQFGRFVTSEERADVDTLGGLVFLLAGRVPTRGEVVTHGSGLEFVVTEADPRRIRKVRITQKGSDRVRSGP